MKRTKNILRGVWSSVLLVTVLAGCYKMDSSYDQFLVDGGVIYPQKASHPVAFSGRNRVRISWLRGADPSVVKARIFWNNGADSAEVDIPHAGGDTISTIIDNLEERTYSFFIKTYDRQGHVSVPVELIAAVYGDRYQAQLLSRPVQLSVLSADTTTVSIQWGAANLGGGAFATEVKYTDTSGNTMVRRFPATEDVSEIPDIEPDSNFLYRTLYLPDSLSLDTFYTAYLSNSRYYFDKTNWKVIAFSSQHPGGQNKVAHLIDGDPATRWHTWVNHSSYPHYATVDMQSTRTITSFELFRVTDGYPERAPETFELLVSTDKIHWTDLGTFNFNRFTNDGQFYEVPSRPKARYFKFVGLTGLLDYMAMGEISVYGL